MGAPRIELHPHQRQRLRAPHLLIGEPGLPDALTHPLHHIALVVGGVPEQQIRQRGGRLLGMPPQHRQILLGDLMSGYGRRQPARDLPSPGQHHHSSHDLVQPMHRGDIVGLSRLPVVLRQHPWQGPSVLAVLRQHPHRLHAHHQIGILIEDPYLLRHTIHLRL